MTRQKGRAKNPSLRHSRDMKAITSIVLAATTVMVADMSEAASEAAAFLKKVEGFRASAYEDSGGTRTIGYGFTSPELLRKGKMSEREASLELSGICRNISARLREELKGQSMTVKEESALISFIYNVGWSNFKGSTMCRLLKEGKRGKEVADEFSRWIYVTRGGRKVVCEGLKERREKERMRFIGMT